jgi:hypothetical protein
MCINAPVSIASFTVGIISSIFLMYKGAPHYALENKTLGIFYIYVSTIQLWEFFMWIDLSGKMGLNKIATMLAPAFIYGQPVVLYLIKSAFYGRQSALFNIAAFFYFVDQLARYVDFIVHDKTLITTPNKDGVLAWKWRVNKEPNYVYTLMFVWAILLYYPLNYAIMYIGLGLVSLAISRITYESEFPAIWCLLNAYLPIFICAGSYFI